MKLCIASYALLAALGTGCWVPVEEGARLTWYGEEFLGRHHAGYWHERAGMIQDPRARYILRTFPERVTETGRGVAVPHYVPLGSLVWLERGDTGQWTVAVACDHLAEDWPGRYDAWPQVAKDLGFGPTFGQDDRGVVPVRVDIYQWGEGEEDGGGRRVAGRTPLEAVWRGPLRGETLALWAGMPPLSLPDTGAARGAGAVCQRVHPTDPVGGEPCTP